MPTVGTCGNCGGPVQVPELWGGSVPPIPTCAHCGATAKNPYGPTIPMQSPVRTRLVRRDTSGHVTLDDLLDDKGA